MSINQQHSFFYGNDFFRNIVDESPVMVWIIDRDGNCIYLNKQWDNYTGLQQEQGMGWGWLQHVHPEDQQLLKKSFLNSNQQPFTIDFRLKRHDGVYRWMKLSGTPAFTPDNDFNGYTASAVDITGHKLYEEAIREKDARLRFALDSGRLGDWDLNMATRQITRSLLHDQAFGYQQLLPRWSYEDFLSHIHPFDRWYIERKFNYVLQEGGNLEFESRVIWPDESLHWIWMRGSVYRNKQGQPVRIIGVISDITHRKQDAEETERQSQVTKTVLDNATACLFLMDRKGHCTYMNPAAERVTGFSFEEVKGKILHNLIHYKHPDGSPFPLESCPIGKSLFRQNPLQTHKDVFIRKDGSFFPVSCTARPVLRNNKLISMVLEFRDISEEKRIQQEVLRKAEREELIRKVAEIASKTFDMDALAQAISAEVCAFFHADRCLVINFRKDSQGEYHTARIMGQYVSSKEITPMVNEDVLDYEVYSTRKEQEKNYALTLIAALPEEFPEQLQAYIRQFGIQAALIYEIFYKGSYYGRIVLHHCKQTHQWTQEEVHLIEEIITLLGAAIHQTELYVKEKAAKDEAVMQRTLLHELFMQAPAMICTAYGPSHTFELVNPLFQQFFEGRKLTGKTVADALPEIADQGIVEILDQVYDTGEPFTGKEIRIKLQKGDGGVKITYFNFVCQAIRNAGGNILGVLLFAYEVTEQVQARKATEESARRLKLVLDAIPHMAWTTFQDGKINFFNQRWRAYTGQDLDQENGGEWMQSVLHPDYKDSVLKQWKLSLQSGKHFEMELLIKSQVPGIYRWHLTRAVPIRDESGLITLWVGTCTDTHDLKLALENLSKAQEQFQFLADFMPQMVWRTQPNGDHDYFNRRWYEYTGLSYQDTKDNGWLMVLHPDDYERTLEIWRHCLSTGDSYQVEYRFRKKDGTYRWFLGRALPLYDEEGKIVKWFGTCTDIHSQKTMVDELALAQEKLFEKNQQLLKINADLDNFVYAASHDLKSPVSNLDGLVTLLSKRMSNKLSANEEEIIRHIHYSAEKLKRTIHELTEITKISKEMDSAPETVSFAEVYQDVRDDLRLVIADTDARIQTNFAVPKINYSRKHLRSILYNLLSNAIKYRAADKLVRIRIETHRIESGTVLRVIDNGLGIAPEQMPKLFGMFKRLHSHVEGSGIGLYMIKRIIENNGGSIHVESQLQKGTTFTIKF